MREPKWKPLPKQGPRRRCMWGGGRRCSNPAVWIEDPKPAKGAAEVLCVEHFVSRLGLPEKVEV